MLNRFQTFKSTNRMASWFGITRQLFFKNSLPTAPEPPVFNPLNDISNCVLWLDANDSSTIEVNEDTSGNNVNRVMKWFDKANPSQQNHYEKDNNPIFSGLYNTHYMNGLNTVYFPGNCYMLHHAGGVTFPFQARTFFAVFKCRSDLTDPSGNPFLACYGSPETGAMGTGVVYQDASGLFQYNICAEGISCGVMFDLSNNPLNQKAIVMYAHSDTDISGNEATYDTISQPLTESTLAMSYSQTQHQYYLNDPNSGNSIDLAEVIMYSRVLTLEEQSRVNDYLADKWNLSGPTSSALNSGNFYASQ